jgi:hypothetical protein
MGGVGMMETNGTFRALCRSKDDEDEVLAIDVDALIVGNFAVHEMVEVLSAWSEDEPLWAGKGILNLSHVPSGMLVYFPERYSGLNRIDRDEWLRQIMDFAAAIEPLADWSDEMPYISERSRIVFNKLREQLPHGRVFTSGKVAAMKEVG